VKIAFISCSNGLGHVKRLLKIVRAFLENNELYQIDLIFAGWQYKSLKNWSVWRELKACSRVKYIEGTFPVCWEMNECYYGEWLLKWHHNLSQYGLDRYNLVVSDNLIEPLVYTNNSVLLSSFFWHRVLTCAFPQNEVIEQYQSWCEKVLADNNVFIISNRYFMMPDIELNYKPKKIGLVGFSDLVLGRKENHGLKNILVALGSSTASKELKEFIIPALEKWNSKDRKIYCSSKLKPYLAEHFEGIEIFGYEKDSLVNMDCALIRAGLGTISDCVTSKVPMIFLNDKCPEINYNEKVLVKLGIGKSVHECQEGEPFFELNGEIYSSMIDNMHELKLGGDMEAAAQIMDFYWRVNG
jgi:hypothetical protein